MEASDRNNDNSGTEDERTAQPRKMDISKVYMVRSAKGTDMLCVNDFLYHYDDCSSKSYRWVCNRRKDKVAMCRSRIITTIIDGDQTKHQVLKVNNEHTHDRCSAKEISKAYERKRVADLAGAPCTLENKMLKRKLLRMEEVSAKKRKQDSGAESDGDFNWPEEVHRINVAARNIKKEQRYEPSDDSNSVGNLFEFNQGSLYLLKTPLGRQMICVDGFLYRLEGKSLTSTTHRWECIKQSEEPCNVRILTERLSSGSHRLKGTHDEQHNHEAFTPRKLTKLLQKNNITVLSKNDETQTKRTTDSVRNFEEITFESNTEAVPAKRTCTMPVPETKQKCRKIITHTHGTGASFGSHAKSPMKPVKTDRTDDPLAAPPNARRNQPDKSKISFLPSAKGNQVLCLDNFIYHYDSRSPHNGRSYWTCILRRDKFFKCNARVTTQMTDKGPVVARLSGTHMHPDSSQEIKRRLQKSIMKNKSGKPSANAGEFLKSSLRDLGRSSKAVLAKSRQAIERKMGRLRRKVQEGLAAEGLAAEGKYKELDSDADETSSSFSSAMNSDDDVELPTKLEEMYEGDALRTYNDEKDGCGGAKIETFYDTACDDLIEEVDLEEEYLEPAHYKDAPDFLEQEHAEPTQNEHERRKSQTAETEAETEPSTEFGHDMDWNKLSILRSVKGGEMLCVDGYIYHWKSASKDRNYWSCIKYKDGVLKCKGRVCTIMTPEGIKVVKATNFHTHPVDETEIRRRMCTEILRSEASDLKPNDVVKMPLHELSDRYAHLVGSNVGQQWTGLQPKHEGATMKLYAVSDGPPSLAVRMALKALNIPFELVNVDYIASEHLSEQYAKMNPQKEIPVLDDNGFYLSESVAIMQYLCDKYAPEKNLYPKDAKERALVNHRLCFNMGFYYASISAHSMAPIFFDYQRTEMSLKKVKNALTVFETYLQRGGTKYAAGAHLTIADLALVSATLCLEAIGFDLSPYRLVKKWYATFKQEYPQLWEIANGGMQEIVEFEKNPPDLSHMNHPFHPTRKTKA